MTSSITSGIEGLRAAGARARQHEKIPDDVLELFPAPQDDLHQPLVRIGQDKAVLENLDGPGDGGQGVPDLVGQPGGHFADEGRRRLFSTDSSMRLIDVRSWKIRIWPILRSPLS